MGVSILGHLSTFHEIRNGDGKRLFSSAGGGGAHWLCTRTRGRKNPCNFAHRERQFSQTFAGAGAWCACAAVLSGFLVKIPAARCCFGRGMSRQLGKVAEPSLGFCIK